MPIGAQAVAQHVSVAPVILGAGHGEAVAEPIELLGIDPKDAKTAFQQGFDDGALRHFDGHPNDLGRGFGPRRMSLFCRTLPPGLLAKDRVGRVAVYGAAPPLARAGR